MDDHELDIVAENHLLRQRFQDLRVKLHELEAENARLRLELARADARRRWTPGGHG